MRNHLNIWCLELYDVLIQCKVKDHFPRKEVIYYRLAIIYSCNSIILYTLRYQTNTA